MCKKRLTLLLLVLFSFCFYSAASEIQQGLTSIEDFAINIQNSSMQQQKQIELLTIDLAESQKLLEDYMKQQNEMLQMQEALLKQRNYYERKYKNWRIAAGVSVSLSIISIGTLIIMMNN